MKFCGNTSYISRMLQKYFVNFYQVLAEQERFIVKMVKIYEKFQNHLKSPIFIETPTVFFFCKFNLNLLC
jgi:hypothetical protein